MTHTTPLIPMKTPFAGKKIILAMPPNAKIYKCIEENLTYNGFKVYMAVFSTSFKYKNIADHARHIFRKVFFKDKSYKLKMIKQYRDNELSQMLSQVQKLDYSLIIRADVYSKQAIEKIACLAHKNYGYQWDALNRYEGISPLINFFDKFYVFDKKDVNIDQKKYPLTNFYFDCYPDLQTNTNFEYDVYFIGNQDKRIDKLLSICQILMQKRYTIKIFLLAKKRKRLKQYSFIQYIDKHIDFKQNLELMAKSRILIDLVDENVHLGLSFRPFEALGYDKKLITNNISIKEYDFYNPFNIFLYEPDNFDLLAFEVFLKTPYIPIAPAIKQKYSFTHWIGHVLETNVDN